MKNAARNRNKYLDIIRLHFESEKSKPLLLWGARQVGKTHLMKAIAEKFFPEALYVNFESDKAVSSLFKEELVPEKIVENLSLHYNRKIDIHSTLLIFDEIQECDDALNSLKYFAEASENYRVLAAGSLLGVKRSKKGFPVGKVRFLDIPPLSFLEFLEFTGHEMLAKALAEMTESTKGFSEAIHTKISRLQREYSWVGGMPEAVITYVNHTTDPGAVRSVQEQILKSYQLDFAKHAPPELVTKIGLIFDQIPRILAKENKKFLYSTISRHARSRDYQDALQWLLDARIIHKIVNITGIELPLASRAHMEIFKIYPLDVGLLGAQLEVAPKTILDQEGIFSSFKGALAECFVAQELTAYGFSHLFYWTSEGTAEVDFVVQKEDKVYPLEVKSGINVRSKSLGVFGERYPHCKLSRASTLNFSSAGKITNYPLYAICHFAAVES